MTELARKRGRPKGWRKAERTRSVGVRLPEDVAEMLDALQAERSTEEDRAVSQAEIVADGIRRLWGRR